MELCGLTIHSMKRIILASKSPRRLEILNKHGIEPILMPTDTEELLPDGIGMEAAVEMLAEQKARACYDAMDPTEYPDSLIIGADTIVYKDEIMGKPADTADAFRMISKYRNTSHYVVTGVCLIDTNTGEATVLSDVTTVYCTDYSDEQIYEYIEEDQPFDKAGAYAIQGAFGKYIDHIEGDYENVMGFPFHRIEEMIR